MQLISTQSQVSTIKTVRSLICALFVVLVQACSLITYESVQPQPSTTYDWKNIEPQLRELNQWTLLGKFSIRTKQDSMTAAINKWAQQDDQFEIDISSTFFGLGSSKLIGNTSFLLIQEGGEEPVSSFEPDTLVETTLGIPLPISHLASWIKALPSDSKRFKQTLNAQGLPDTLVQDDWKLTFSQYHEDTKLPLPGKIKIERNDIRITLAIKKWTLQ